jgi:hypothetical protein
MKLNGMTEVEWEVILIHRKCVTAERQARRIRSKANMAAMC